MLHSWLFVYLALFVRLFVRSCGEKEVRCKIWNNRTCCEVLLGNETADEPGANRTTWESFWKCQDHCQQFQCLDFEYYKQIKVCDAPLLGKSPACTSEWMSASKAEKSILESSGETVFLTEWPLELSVFRFAFRNFPHIFRNIYTFFENIWTSDYPLMAMKSWVADPRPPGDQSSGPSPLQLPGSGRVVSNEVSFSTRAEDVANSFNSEGNDVEEAVTAPRNVPDAFRQNTSDFGGGGRSAIFASLRRSRNGGPKNLSSVFKKNGSDSAHAPQATDHTYPSAKEENLGNSAAMPLKMETVIRSFPSSVWDVDAMIWGAVGGLFLVLSIIVILFTIALLKNRNRKEITQEKMWEIQDDSSQYGPEELDADVALQYI